MPSTVAPHSTDLAPAADRSVFIERFELGGDGLRIAIKDVADVKGYSTRLGSAAFDGAPVATEHAEVVKRLIAAGAALVGKTSLHELAYGVTGLNSHYGTPQNPMFPGRIPGGSSSGSAVAVATGDADAAIGTDTGGSIRVPAACCGVYGFKPTFGRVSRKGFTPTSSSLDCVGVFAAHLDVLDSVLGMIAPSWRVETHETEAKVGWLKCAAEPSIWMRTRQAVESLQSHIEDFEAKSFVAANHAGLTIIARETFNTFGRLVGSGLLGSDVETRLLRAGRVSDADVSDAELVREAFTSELQGIFQSVDVLALPVLAQYPPRVKDAADLAKMVSITDLCRPFNLSGHPAIAIPLPPENGLPVSLQLVAAAGHDEVLLNVASELVGALGLSNQPSNHAREA